MKQIKIIKKISNIFSTIPNFLIIFLIFFCASIYYLKDGVYLDSFSNKFITIEKLYLKFDKKLILNIKNLKINTKNKENNSSLSYIEEFKFLDFYFYILSSFFTYIQIDKLNYNNHNFKIFYNKSILRVNSKILSLKAKVKTKINNSIINLYDLNLKDKNIKITDSIFIYNFKNSKIFMKGSYDINSKINGNFYALINKNIFKFKINSNKTKDLSFIKELFPIDNEINEIINNISIKNYIKLDFLYANIDLNNTKNIMDNIFIKAKAFDFSYKFNEQLKSIRTKEVDIFYINDSIILIPNKETFYSKVKIKKIFILIDKLNSDTKLNIYLKTKAKINNEVLDILKAYEIDLPFIQVSGDTQIELNLIINLINFKSKQYGIFKINEDSGFLYKDEIIKLSKTILYLNNDKTYAKKAILKYDKYAKAYADFYMDIPKLKAKIDLDFEYIFYNFAKPFYLYTPLKAKIFFDEEKLSAKTTKFKFKYKNYIFSNEALNFIIKDNFINFDNSKLKINNFFDSKYNIKYNIKNKTADIKLLTKIFDLNVGEINLVSIPNTKLTSKLKINKNDFNLSINELDFKFLKEGDENKFELKKLENFFFISKLLQDFFIGNGELNINTKDYESFNMSGKTFYNKNILYKNSKLVRLIKFKSKYENNALKINLNNKIDINISKLVNIKIKDYDLSVKGLESLKNKDDDENKESKKIILKGQNSKIILNDTETYPFNSYKIIKEKDRIKGSLFYKKSFIDIDINNTHYNIYANNLNEKFIKTFTKIKWFDGGSFNIHINGRKDKLEIYIIIENTIIKNLALFNNIMAFFNTIPSIISYKNPGFNEEGYKIKEAKIHLFKENNLYKFKNINLIGYSTDVSGSGELNLDDNSTNFTLNISALKSLNNIINNTPIINYLIMGDNKSLTTTVKVKGNINSPKIYSELYKDILYTPVNIIKRIFYIPEKLIKSFENKNP